MSGARPPAPALPPCPFRPPPAVWSPCLQYQDVIEETREFTVPKESADTRLDVYLVQAAPDFSRSFLKRLIDNGLVSVNHFISKPGCKLRGGDLVTLNVPKPVTMEAVPEDIPLDVLYEDEHIVVVNKQAGIVVHSSPGHERGTLVNALLHHCGDLAGIGGELRPGIVHRLDMDTSGCIVCAKTDLAQRNLTDQFSARAVGKRYLAITHGVPRPPEGKVEGYILRQPQDWMRRLFLPESSEGKYSLTFYRTLAACGGFALVECTIKTGRTHQIRLHLKSLGAPVLCDMLYGREYVITPSELRGRPKTPMETPALRRQALHAAYISFAHPADGRPLEFTAPMPEDMRQVLAILGLEG